MGTVGKMEKTGSPTKRKKTHGGSMGKEHLSSFEVLTQKPRSLSPNVDGTGCCDDKNTAEGDKRGQQELMRQMNRQYPPMHPRSPWRKWRRLSNGGGEIEDDLFDEDSVWTDAENFKFERQCGHNSGYQSPPNGISAEASNLSFGTLDLSANSENGSECKLGQSSDVSVEHNKLLNSSTMSPKSHFGNMSSNSANNASRASTQHLSPDSHHARDLETSATPESLQGSHNKMCLSSSPSRPGVCSPNRPGSDMAFPLPGRPRLMSPFVTMQTESPMQPQRLFNPGQNDNAAGVHAPAHNHSHPHGVPPVHPAEQHSQSVKQECADQVLKEEHAQWLIESGQLPRRRNPFLGIGAVNILPQESYARRMSLCGKSNMPLTVRSFWHDFVDFQEIGSGRFGKVYKCFRKIDLCPYAVKEIAHEFRGEQDRERILKEIYAHASQANNIHVVRYYNAWEQEDNLYIQTELCSGTLAKLKEKEGPLDDEKIKDILVQLSAGLAYMHAHNLVHLDIRPDNLFWTHRGIYKLGGFGLVTPSEAREHVVESNKLYLSAEMLQLDFSNLTKADIFALGLTLYELASPNPLPTNSEAYHNLRQGHIPPLENMSPALFHLIQFMMHPEASYRPSAADLVRHPLLYSLLKNESAACLRVAPPRQVDPSTDEAGILADQGNMLKTHLRALQAEKKVTRLQLRLQESQQQAKQYKDIVEQHLGKIPDMPDIAGVIHMGLT